MKEVGRLELGVSWELVVDVVCRRVGWVIFFLFNFSFLVFDFVVVE